jgi:hypothetical protein
LQENSQRTTGTLWSRSSVMARSICSREASSTTLSKTEQPVTACSGAMAGALFSFGETRPGSVCRGDAPVQIDRPDGHRQRIEDPP